MSDAADRAQDQIENEAFLREKYRPVVLLDANPTGVCLNCDEPLAKNMRWCDADCQLDWEKRK